MSNEVGFNQQYLKLKMQYEFLKEQCANQLELYTHLVEVEGPQHQGPIHDAGRTVRASGVRA